MTIVDVGRSLSLWLSPSCKLDRCNTKPDSMEPVVAPLYMHTYTRTIVSTIRNRPLRSFRVQCGVWLHTRIHHISRHTNRRWIHARDTTITILQFCNVVTESYSHVRRHVRNPTYTLVKASRLILGVGFLGSPAGPADIIRLLRATYYIIRTSISYYIGIDPTIDSLFLKV